MEDFFKRIDFFTPSWSGKVKEIQNVQKEFQAIIDGPHLTKKDIDIYEKVIYTPLYISCVLSLAVTPLIFSTPWMKGISISRVFALTGALQLLYTSSDSVTYIQSVMVENIENQHLRQYMHYHIENRTTYTMDRKITDLVIKQRDVFSAKKSISEYHALDSTPSPSSSYSSSPSPSPVKSHVPPPEPEIVPEKKTPTEAELNQLGNVRRHTRPKLPEATPQAQEEEQAQKLNTSGAVKHSRRRLPEAEADNQSTEE